MEREALLIIDMINDFVDSQGKLTVGKPAQDIVAYIIEEANKTIRSGGIVVFAQDNHPEGKDPPFPDHADPKTSGATLWGPLDEWYLANCTFAIGYESSSILVVKKTKFSAFHKTELNQLLLERDIKTVKLCGVCTDICNLATAFDAHSSGYKIVALKRGMATFSNHGEVAIQLMKQNFAAEVID